MIPITHIVVQRTKPSTRSSLMATARVVLADCLQLAGINIYRGMNGLFVWYPTDPRSKGPAVRQLYWPITREFRAVLEQAILAEHAAAPEWRPDPDEE